MKYTPVQENTGMALALAMLHIPHADPLAYIVRGGPPAMQTVRRLLDARRAG